MAAVVTAVAPLLAAAAAATAPALSTLVVPGPAAATVV